MFIYGGILVIGGNGMVSFVRVCRVKG